MTSYFRDNDSEILLVVVCHKTVFFMTNLWLKIIQKQNISNFCIFYPYLL